MKLEDRGRLLVAEDGRADTLRVVEASLAPPAWMGPVDAAAEAAAEAHEEKAQQIEQLLGDYGKLVEDGCLAGVVFVVEGGRFPAYRGVLAASGASTFGGGSSRGCRTGAPRRCATRT